MNAHFHRRFRGRSGWIACLLPLALGGCQDTLGPEPDVSAGSVQQAWGEARTTVGSNAVLVWNETLLEAIRTTPIGPPQAARAMAMVHGAVYDAWAAYDPVAVGTRFGGSLRRPVEEHTAANK